ncbi:MAG: hypothetical protein R3C03_19765 [Pirellulaceae bacterium]
MSSYVTNQRYGYCKQYSSTRSPSKPKSGNTKIWLLVGIWLLLMLFGGVGFLMMRGGKTVAEAAPTAWPLDTNLSRRADWKTVLLFVDPHCPATATTLDDFEESIENERVTSTIVFFQGRENPQELESSPNVERARGISDASIVFDRDGHEFARFGIKNSGQVLVYDTNNSLIYEGDTFEGTTPNAPANDNSPNRKRVNAILTSTTTSGNGNCSAAAALN